MTRVRSVDPVRCLVVPVDVGSGRRWRSSLTINGEVVVAPFELRLDEPGVCELLSVIEMAVRDRAAVVCRVGVESAGH
jgi:transposase